MSTDETFAITIGETEAGERLDAVLAAAFEEVSRSYLQKLIEAGSVTRNGVPCLSKKQKLEIGDELALRLPPPREVTAEPEDIPLSIVFEDADLLVVDKPKGMVVHPASGNETGTLVNAVLFHCREDLSTINGVIRPGIVHRIDKDTSGLLMVAKNDVAHRSLAVQLAAHSIRRAYHAVVYNNFAEDEGMVDAPLGRDPANRMRRAVLREGGKEAVTHYHVLERFGRFTYIEAQLETGRTHQIRVHMAYIKHPLLGDPLYGPAKKALGVSTQMLHARMLGFTHPRTGEEMLFHSDLPEEFEKVLTRLRQG